MMGLRSLSHSLLQYTNGVLSTLFGWNNEDYDPRGLSTLEALSYPAIWFGVSKIAGHVGQMPLYLYKKRKDNGADKQEANSHAVAGVLRRPNPLQISMTFRQTLMVHALMDGNGRAAIVRDAMGNPVELLLLDPDLTATVMVDGDKVHVTRPPEWDRLRQFFPVYKGQNERDGLILIEDADVVHVLGLSVDGLSGIPLKKVCKRSIKTGIDAEKRVAKQMQSGFTGRIFLQAPPGVFRKQEDAEEFLEHVKKRHSAHGDGEDIGMLREGITANVVDMSNKEAEMAAVRLFQRQDAALLLGLEGILGDDTSVSYNSAEQKNIAYLSMLNRYLVPIEQEFEVKLLTKNEYRSGRYYMRFVTGHLLKSDAKTTMETLSLAVQSELMTSNEARAKLELNPIEGGDKLRNPAINPAEPAAPAAEPVSDPVEESAAALAVRARLSHLIGVEAGKVSTAATQAHAKGRNFLSWVDNFYSKKWEPQFANMLEEVGLDRELSTIHCAESMRRLLEVCDYSTPETLAENVSKCVSSWKLRANTIGEMSNV